MVISFRGPAVSQAGRALALMSLLSAVAADLRQQLVAVRVEVLDPSAGSTGSVRVASGHSDSDVGFHVGTRVSCAIANRDNAAAYAIIGIDEARLVQAIHEEIARQLAPDNEAVTVPAAVEVVGVLARRVAISVHEVVAAFGCFDGLDPRDEAAAATGAEPQDLASPAQAVRVAARAGTRS